MDSLGVDVQVVSTSAAFYMYDRDPGVTLAIASECNNEVHQFDHGPPRPF